MKLPQDAHEVLTVLAAPALVCTRNATVIDVNSSAASWLGTSRKAVAGRSLGDMLNTTAEPLEHFVERSLRDEHALISGHLYLRADRSRRKPKICQGQRLLGPAEADTVLLMFANAIVPRPAATSLTSATRVRVNDVGPAEELVGKPGADPSCPGNPSTLGEIALGLAHEVYQPLTAIATYAHSCQRWVKGGQADHPKLLPTLDKIIEQVHATGQLIASLKGLVHDHEDARRSCDLNGLVRDSLGLLALDPRVEDCAIESRLESEICNVNVNPEQIQLILLNLMRNAVEASLAVEGSAPTVCIAVQSEKGRANVTVRDSGPGVTAAAGRRLFEPFVSGKSDGRGLGLVISRRLATAHAGRVECLSGVPHGAAFQLSLPSVR